MGAPLPLLPPCNTPPGVAAGGVELAPEGPGPPERIAGQGGVEAADGDGGILQRRDDPAGDEQVSHYPSRTGMPSPSDFPLIKHFRFEYSSLSVLINSKRSYIDRPVFSMFAVPTSDNHLSEVTRVSLSGSS